MTRNRKIFLLLVLGWLCFIFGHSMMDHSATYNESTAIWEPLQEISTGISHELVRNIAHFLIFAVWGGLLYGLFRQYEHFHLLKPISVALCGGFADETIQLFVPGRYGEVVDIWLDLAGATFVILLVHLVTQLVVRRRKKANT